MTVINANTFVGPNQGSAEGYIPQTTIESAKIDADLIQILNDLDAHLALHQVAFTKLDQIDLAQLGAVTATDVVPVINASGLKIDADNLDSTVIVESELADAIDVHRSTTLAAYMHPETSIKSTELTYSNTPTTLITTCANLLDEIKNIRYQIKRVTGKTNWSDTPDSSLASLYTSLNSTISTLNSHVGAATLHLTSNQQAAIAAAFNPSASNRFATVSDVNGLGSGDMTKATYDANNDGCVDKATALLYNGVLKDYNAILSQIASDINIHKAAVSAHHTRYSDAEAIGAINGDTDHSLTAKHYYGDLLNKPPANAFTSTEVSNIRASKLSNGTTPWVGAVTLAGNGYINPGYLPIEYINSAWTEASGKIASQAYFSSSNSGSVGDTWGPNQCMLLGGMGYATSEYGYLQYSLNGGSTWRDCNMSPAMIRAPSSGGPNMRIWTCPIGILVQGTTFKIRAGSTFTGSASEIFGGGFYIRYKYI